MGTGRSGSYLNTQAAKGGVSIFAKVHSYEGTFNKPCLPTDILRLKSGGHGQENIRLLDKYGIKYKITKTYRNGVREGIVYHQKNNISKYNMPHMWFPKSWSSKDIKKAGEHVSKLKKNRHAPNGKPVYGTYKGVRVGIIKRDGVVRSVFPSYNQSPAIQKGKQK